jgi:hypothetical protein
MLKTDSFSFVRILFVANICAAILMDRRSLVRWSPVLQARHRISRLSSEKRNDISAFRSLRVTSTLLDNYSSSKSILLDADTRGSSERLTTFELPGSESSRISPWNRERDIHPLPMLQPDLEMVVAHGLISFAL